MSQDLKLQVLLNAVDRVSGPLRKILGGTSATAKALKEAKDRLRDLNRTQEQVQGFRKISAQASESAVALKAAQQKAAQLRAGMAGLENPTKKATLALDRAERSVGKLRRAHLDNLRALKDSKAGLDRSGLAVNKLAEHERRLRAETDRTTDQIARQGRELDKLTSRTNKLQMARRKLDQARGLAGASASAGASMGAVATAAAAPVVMAVQAYTQFEDAMLGVARQMQGARDAGGNLTPVYYQMAEEVKRMAQRIPMATTEIAALVEAGARLGIQGKENLLAFAETTAITSNAFGLPVEEIGANMAKLAGLYKIPIKNIGQLGDVINWLDDNALASGGDIIEVMKRVNGLSDKLNYRQAAALGSTFLSLGTGPEVAASATNAMVRELGIATMQGKRFQGGLRMLGLDAKKLQNNMTVDATGTILSVLDAIKALPKEQQLEATTRLFGKEFGDDAAKLANNLGEYRRQLDLVNQAQARGSMQREAAARLKNLSTNWQMLKNTVFNVGVDLGSTLAPQLKELMTNVGSVLRGVRDWVKENPNLAGTLMKATAALAGLLAVASAIALAFASVLTPLALLRWSVATLGLRLGGLMTPISWLFRTAVPMLGKVLLWVGRLMMTNPILLILTAVAGAAYLIWKNWSTIGPAIAGMWDSITVYAQNAWNGVLGFIGGLWTRFKGVGAQLMQGLIAGLLGGLKAVGDTIRGIGDQVVGWFKTKLGIRSPSRVFAMLGDYTMQGLAGGLDRSRSLPIQAMQRATGGLRAAGAGLALAAATPAVAIDQRGPIARPAMQAPAGDTYHITIQAAGSAAQDIAAAVRAEIERINREKAARQRSTLSDYN